MNKVTRFISNILFDKEIDLVSFPLKTNHQFWDSFVKIGSSHYVIPALYYKLKQRQYLKLLNNELVSYLKEIYNQNLKRNIELVKESKEISSVLKQNNIDHVFLKGTALISSIYSDKLGVRMIGDIDILVEKSQILKAQELIKKNNYVNLHKYDGLIGRHLPRLINDNKIFSIELHDLLIHKNCLHLNPNTLLRNKMVQKINILNWKDFLLHIILNFQVNDHGSLKANFSFRTLYDVYSLNKFNPKIFNQLDKSIHIEKLKLIISNLNVLNFNNSSILLFFKLRLYLKSNSLIYNTIESIIINTILSANLNFLRIKEFIKNNEYRLHVLNKLGLIK